MKVISLMNPKGGVGKSTLTINIARGFQLRGNKVTVIDTDTTQLSCATWRKNTHDTYFPVVQGRAENIDETIAKYKDSDLIIIDCLGKSEMGNLSLVVSSDAVVIPVQPSDFDLSGTLAIEKILKALKSPPESAYVMTRVDMKSNEESELREVLSDSDIPTFIPFTRNIVAYKRSISASQTIYEYNKDAVKEVNSIVDEIEELIK